MAMRGPMEDRAVQLSRRRILVFQSAVVAVSLCHRFCRHAESETPGYCLQLDARRGGGSLPIHLDALGGIFLVVY